MNTPKELRKRIDKINFSFVTNALKNMEPVAGQFCVAVASTDTNNFLVMSDPRLSDKEVISVLRECIKAVQAKGGGIILLN